MTTSGTYQFFPTNAEILLEAFDRCQIRPSAITNDHMVSARRSLNLELSVYNNRGINLWEVDLQEIALEEGVTDYELDQETMIVLDVYISQEFGQDQPIDRILSPIGRTDWAMIPNKTQTGVPTVYWFDRTRTPTLHIWQPAQQDDTYTLKYYRMKQVQDANPSLTQTPDITIRFVDALCAGLAARLARKYAPTLVSDLQAEADRALSTAMTEDRERAPFYIAPDLGSYNV